MQSNPAPASVTISLARWNMLWFRVILLEYALRSSVSFLLDNGHPRKFAICLQLGRQ